MTDADGGVPDDRLAPVIPLFDQDPVDIAGPTSAWHTTWGEPPAVVGDEDQSASTSVDETLLLRRLRVRSLSVSEARALLAEQGATPEFADEIIAAFEGRGYLDDAALAEQVRHVAVDRKGQGRRAVAQALTARRLPREIIDATLADLEDDDDERALEYARSKARSVRDLPPEAALRRLAGQLARRGYGSRAALGAARTALAEARGDEAEVRRG